MCRAVAPVRRLLAVLCLVLLYLCLLVGSFETFAYTSDFKGEQDASFNSTLHYYPEKPNNPFSAFYRFYQDDFYLGFLGKLLILPGVKDGIMLLEWFIRNTVSMWFFQQNPSFARFAQTPNEQQLMQKTLNQCRSFPVQIEDKNLAAKMAINAVCPDNLQAHWLFKASPVDSGAEPKHYDARAPGGIMELERLWYLMNALRLRHLSVHPVTEDEGTFLAIRTCESELCETLWLDIRTNTPLAPQWLLRQIMADDRSGSLTISALDERILFQINEAINCLYQEQGSRTGKARLLDCNHKAQLFSKDASLEQRHWIYTPHLLHLQHHPYPWLFQGKGLRILPLSASTGSNRYRNTPLYIRWMEDTLNNVGPDDRHDPVVILSSDQPQQGLRDYHELYYAKDTSVLGSFYNDLNILEVLLGTFLYAMSFQVNGLAENLVSVSIEDVVDSSKAVVPFTTGSAKAVVSPPPPQASESLALPGPKVTDQTVFILQHLQTLASQPQTPPVHSLATRNDQQYLAQFQSSGSRFGSPRSLQNGQNKKGKHKKQRKNNDGDKRPPRPPWQPPKKVDTKPEQTSFDTLKSLLESQGFMVGNLTPLHSLAQLPAQFPSGFVEWTAANTIQYVPYFPWYIAQMPWADRLEISESFLQGIFINFDHRNPIKLSVLAELLQRDMTVFTVQAPGHHTYHRYSGSSRQIISELVYFYPEGYQNAQIYLFSIGSHYYLMESLLVPVNIPATVVQVPLQFPDPLQISVPVQVAAPQPLSLVEAREHPQLVSSKTRGGVKLTPINDQYMTLQESYVGYNQLLGPDNQYHFQNPEEFQAIILRQLQGQQTERDNSFYLFFLIECAAKAGAISLPVPEFHQTIGIEATKTFIHLISESWLNLEPTLKNAIVLPTMIEAQIPQIKNKIEQHVYNHSLGHLSLVDIPLWFIMVFLPGSLGFIQIQQQLIALLAEELLVEKDHDGKFKAAVYGSQAARSLIVRHGFDNNYLAAMSAGLPAANDIDIMAMDRDTAEKILTSITEKIKQFPSRPRLSVAPVRPFSFAGGKAQTYRAKVSVDSQKILIIDISYSTDPDFFDWETVQVNSIPGVEQFLSFDGMQHNLPSGLPGHLEIQVPMLGLDRFIKVILADTEQTLDQVDAERRIINAYKYLWLLRSHPLTVATMTEKWGPGWLERIKEFLRQPQLSRAAIEKALKEKAENTPVSTPETVSSLSNPGSSVPDSIQVNEMTGEANQVNDEPVISLLPQEQLSGHSSELTPEPVPNTAPEIESRPESKSDPELKTTPEKQSKSESKSTSGKKKPKISQQTMKSCPQEPEGALTLTKNSIPEPVLLQPEVELSQPGLDLPDSPASAPAQLSGYFPDFNDYEASLVWHHQQDHWYFNHLGPELQGTYWLWQALHEAGVRQTETAWRLDSTALKSENVRESLRRSHLCGDPIASFLWHYQNRLNHQDYLQPSLYKAALVYEPARLLILQSKLNLKAPTFDPKGIVRLAKLAADRSPLDQPILFSEAQVTEFKASVVERALSLLYRDKDPSLASAQLIKILYSSDGTTDPAVLAVMIAAGLQNHLPDGWQTLCSSSQTPVILWACRGGGIRINEKRLAQLSGTVFAYDAEQLILREKQAVPGLPWDKILYSGNFLFNPVLIKKQPTYSTAGIPAFKKHELLSQDLLAETPTGDWLQYEDQQTDEARIAIAQQGYYLRTGKRSKLVLKLFSQLTDNPALAPLVHFWQGQQLGSKRNNTLLTRPKQAGFSYTSQHLTEPEQLSLQWPELQLQSARQASEKQLFHALKQSAAIFIPRKNYIEIQLDMEQLSRPDIYQVLAQASELNNSEANYLMGIIAYLKNDPMAQVYMKRAALDYLPARNLLALWTYKADSPYFDPGAMARIYDVQTRVDEPKRVYQVFPYKAPDNLAQSFARQWFEASTDNKRTHIAATLRVDERKDQYTPGEFPDMKMMALLSSGAIEFLPEMNHHSAKSILNTDNPHILFAQIVGEQQLQPDNTKKHTGHLASLLTGRQLDRASPSISPLELAARVRYALSAPQGLSGLSSWLEQELSTETLLLRTIYTDQLLFNKSALRFLAEMLSGKNPSLSLIAHREIARQFPEHISKWLSRVDEAAPKSGKTAEKLLDKVKQLVKNTDLDEKDLTRIQGYLKILSPKEAKSSKNHVEGDQKTASGHINMVEGSVTKSYIARSLAQNWKKEVNTLMAFMEKVPEYSPYWFASQQALFVGFNELLVQRIEAGDPLEMLVADETLIKHLIQHEHALGFLLSYLAEHDFTSTSPPMRRVPLMLAAKGVDIGARILASQLLGKAGHPFYELRILRTIVRPGSWRIPLNKKIEELFEPLVTEPNSAALVELIMNVHSSALESLDEADNNPAGLAMEQRRLAIFRVIEIMDESSDLNEVSSLSLDQKDEYQQALLVTLQRLEETGEDPELQQFILNSFSHLTFDSPAKASGQMSILHSYQQLKQDIPEIKDSELSRFLPWTPDFYRHPGLFRHYTQELTTRDSMGAYILANDSVFWYSAKHEARALYLHLKNEVLPVLLNNKEKNQYEFELYFNRMTGLILSLNHPDIQPGHQQMFSELKKQVKRYFSGEKKAKITEIIQKAEADLRGRNTSRSMQSLMQGLPLLQHMVQVIMQE